MEVRAWGYSVILAVLLAGCVTTPDVSDTAPTETPVTHRLRPEAIQIPNWKNPFWGIESMQSANPPRCVLVVDATANRNAWMERRSTLSAQGIFDHLSPVEAERLGQKGWEVLPFENSLYADRQVQGWAEAQGMKWMGLTFDSLSADDKSRYFKEVVAVHYGPLHRVQVIRLLSRPSALHKVFFGSERPWKTNEQGLFVSHDQGDQSIYRVGLVDFKNDPRTQWPHAETTSASIKYERRAQLRDTDWERLAHIAPDVRTPSEAGPGKPERLEVGIHLSLVENFIYFLPDCAPRD